MDVIVKNNFNRSRNKDNKNQKVKVIQYSMEPKFIVAGGNMTFTLKKDDYLTIHIDPKTGKEENRYILYHKNLDGHVGYEWRCWLGWIIHSPHSGPYQVNSEGRRVDIGKIIGLQKHWNLVIATGKFLEDYDIFSEVKDSDDHLIKVKSVNSKNVEVGDENQDPDG
jgi:hypothetical protein